jgi:phage-related minor tail protein
MPDATKKISIILPIHLIRQMEERGLKQSDTGREAIEFYLSDDYQKIEEDKKKILEQEKQILILEAKLEEADGFKALLIEQNELSRAHISQVQSLLQQMDNERRSREDIIRQKENKILLLEDKKRKWYRFW